MIRTQIQFSDAQLRRLRAIARREQISVAEAVRRCVDATLDAAPSDRGARWQRALTLAGAFRDREGRSDVGEAHDDFLHEAFLDDGTAP